MKLMPKTPTLLNITAFGLKPETSKFALQINYCLLLARRHIWLAKSKEMPPNFDHYLRFLKSRKKRRYRKMGTSCRIYTYLLIDSITSSEAFAVINFANHLVYTLSPTSFSQQSALYLRSRTLIILYVISLTIHLKHLFRFLPFCTTFIFFSFFFNVMC